MRNSIIIKDQILNFGVIFVNFDGFRYLIIEIISRCILYTLINIFQLLRYCHIKSFTYIWNDFAGKNNIKRNNSIKVRKGEASSNQMKA